MKKGWRRAGGGGEPLLYLRRRLRTVSGAAAALIVLIALFLVATAAVGKGDLADAVAVLRVLVDESQFLNKAQVWQLTDVVDKLRIPVLAYGLRTDFRGELFEGSQYLLAFTSREKAAHAIETLGVSERARPTRVTGDARMEVVTVVCQVGASIAC